MLKPTYVTFEQAKWLKEKGFNEECKYYYDIEFKELTFHIGYVDDIYKNSELEDEISAPEQHHVVEWLRLKYGIWVYVKQGYLWEWNIESIENKPKLIYNDGLEDSPQAAYSTAFDYIKNNNLI
jgi:hypothetical protein